MLLAIAFANFGEHACPYPHISEGFDSEMRVESRLTSCVS
ncbi:hypothetical protein V7x_42780 [Crateriforma conspicua]|uniref:Uncharacterized protein n=1 Tax=Crateriforma conspicua TaxID=2527996 RepID=A0A5C6FQ21_9PLAN|nr:hypothetical protein V7x_42780 [Crateriforma conspicua]